MMNLDFENSIIICPSSQKRDWLEYRNKNPLVDFHLYSLEEFNALFRYAYEESAVTHLLKKGYGLAKAYALVSDLSSLSLNDEIEPSFHKELAELVSLGLFYRLEFPEKLFEGKKIYYSGIDELALKESKRHLPSCEFIPLREAEREEKAPCYSFGDSYKEAHYLLNDIAKEIDSGRDPSRIFVYGASKESKELLHNVAPRYGFSFSGYSIPLSSHPSFRKFLSSISEVQSDRDTLMEIGGEEETVKKIGPLVKTFESFPLEERRKYYAENSHSLEVAIASSFSGPSFSLSANVPKDSLLYIIDASLGNFPSSTSEDYLLDDKTKERLCLLTSKEENLLREKEAQGLLNSPSLKWASYARKSGSENVEPSYLLGDIQEAPIQDYEYDHDEGALLASFLLDAAADSGHEDGRLTSISEEVRDKHDSFPRSYQKFTSFHKPSSHSYSSLGTYPKCPYEYYCSKILSLDVYEENFSTRLGSYFHKAIEEYCNGKTVEEAHSSAIKIFDESTERISAKERVLLKKYEDFLPIYLKWIDERKKYFAEHKSSNEAVVKGQVSSGASYYAKLDELIDFGEDVAIIDYKTTSAQSFKEDLFLNHALSLQLPFYAMSIKNSEKYAGKRVSGLFIAPIVLDNNALGIIDDVSEIDEEKLFKKWRLDGIMGVERMSTLVGDEAGLDAYFTKHTYSRGKEEPAPNLEEIDSYASMAEKYLETFDWKIGEGEFERTPFRILGSSKFYSCEYCSFRDVCYRKEEEVIFKNEDEGQEENAYEDE